MAAIAHTGGQFDLDAFFIAVQKALPPYARPVFLRLMPSVDTTGDSLMQGHANTHIHKVTPEVTFSFLSSGTFKIQKTRLQKEGYKPQDESEKMYFLNSRAGCYEAVTEELHNSIMEGTVCL